MHDLWQERAVEKCIHHLIDHCSCPRGGIGRQKSTQGEISRKGFTAKLVVQKKFYSLVSSRSASYLYLQVISKPLFLSLNPEVWLKEAFTGQTLHSSKSSVPQLWKIPSGYHQVNLPSSSGDLQNIHPGGHDLSPSQCLAYISNHAAFYRIPA